MGEREATRPDARGRELGARPAAGYPHAVGDLYRAYGRLVFMIAFKILGDHGHAEEATQTAFTKLWQARERDAPDRDIRPLLFTAARRVAYDMREHGMRRSWTALEEPAVEDGTDRMLTAWQVREALEDLPDEERQIVRMQHLDGLSHSEIAERLDLPLGTVKSPVVPGPQAAAHATEAAARGGVNEMNRTCEDQQAAYLEGDPEAIEHAATCAVCEPARARLDALRAALGDASTWAEPASALEHRGSPPPHPPSREWRR